MSCVRVLVALQSTNGASRASLLRSKVSSSKFRDDLNAANLFDPCEWLSPLDELLSSRRGKTTAGRVLNPSSQAVARGNCARKTYKDV